MSRPFADADPFRAIADPTRRKILDLLREKERTVGEIQLAVHRSPSALSRHLAVLRSVGLITQRRSGLNRKYRLRVGQLKQIDRWIDPYRGKAAKR